jgi:nicotinamide-nucleotide amidase
VGARPAGLAELLGLDRAALVAAVDALRRRGWTVATAESLTAGLLTATLTEVPGSSAVVRGGLVVYATELKHELAGVDATLLARTGPVDPTVAEQLAEGARRRCGADLGVGLTGVAGPDPQDGVPVGTWFCAVRGPAGATATVRGRAVDAATVPSRAAVRAAVVRAAVGVLGVWATTGRPPDASQVDTSPQPGEHAGGGTWTVGAAFPEAGCAGGGASAAYPGTVGPPE